MFSKSTTQLLDKYNRGLCRSEHNNLIHLRDINTFIEYIHSENVIEIIPMLCSININLNILRQQLNRSFSFLLRICTGKRLRLISPIIKYTT